MHFNAYLVATRLAGIESRRIVGDAAQAPLSFLAWYGPGCVPEAGGMYVAYGSEIEPFESPQAPYAFISIGEAPQFLLDDEYCSLVCCRSVLSKSIVFREVRKILVFLEDWNDSLLAILAAAKDECLEQLLSVSAEVFGNPLELYNSNFRIVAIGEKKGVFDYPREIVDAETGFLSESLMNRFSRDEVLASSHNASGPQFYQEADTRSVACNLFAGDGSFMARLTVASLYRDSDDGDLFLFGRLAEMVLLCIAVSDPASIDHDNRARHAVCEYVFGDDPMPEGRVVRNLERLGWQKTGKFRLAYVVPDAVAVGTRSTDYFGYRIEREFKGVLALPREKDIAVLVNEEALGRPFDEFIDDFDEFLKEGRMFAGVGTTFIDFVHAHGFFLQAQAAYRFGITSSLGKTSLCRFESCALRQVLEHGFDSLPAETFIPLDIIGMGEYDGAHNSEYLYTLLVWFEENRNMAESAKRLNIHIATMRYRIKRIEAMMPGYDLENSEVAMYLRCLFQARDALGLHVSRSTVPEP